MTGCGTDDELYREVQNNPRVYNKIYNDVVNQEIIKITQGNDTNTSSAIVTMIDKKIIQDMVENEYKKYQHKYKTNKKFRNYILKIAKKQLTNEIKLNKDLIVQVQRKIQREMEQELRIKKEREKDIDQDVENTIRVLKKNIEYLKSLEPEQIHAICDTIYSDSVHQTGKWNKNGFCEIAIIKNNNKYRFASLSRASEHGFLSQQTTIEGLKFLSKIDDLAEEGIVGQRIKMLIKYKQKQEEYLQYIEEIQIKQSALKVARTLNDTKLLSKLEKELATTMRSISKRLSLTNVK